jgi:hypothetical protein
VVAKSVCACVSQRSSSCPLIPMFHQELQTQLWNFEATVRPPFSLRASAEEDKSEPPSTRSSSAPREPAPWTSQAPCFPRALAALSLTPTHHAQSCVYLATTEARSRGQGKRNRKRQIELGGESCDRTNFFVSCLDFLCFQTSLALSVPSKK